MNLNEAWQLGSDVVYVMGSGKLRALDFATTTLVLTCNFR